MLCTRPPRVPSNRGEAGEIDFDTITLHDPDTGELITNELIDRENDEIDRRYGRRILLVNATLR